MLTGRKAPSVDGWSRGSFLISYQLTRAALADFSSDFEDDLPDAIAEGRSAGLSRRSRQVQTLDFHCLFSSPGGKRHNSGTNAPGRDYIGR